MSYRLIISLFGSSGILLGAFGAHLLKPSLPLTQMDTFKTAVFYQLIHTLALLCLETTSGSSFTWPKRFFTSGIILFSGSLYILILTGLPLLGWITPLGGLLLVLGWLGLLKTHWYLTSS